MKRKEENCALLSYYATGSCNSLPTFRDNLTGEILRVQESRLEPIGCRVTSLRNYHYPLRNNSEERSSIYFGAEPEIRL
jgi:hypothetical protein